MCGIAGIVDPAAGPDELRAASRGMIALQKHRGPDGEAYYDADAVSLGHARLAIIDLSELGRQPMCDADSRLWITYNGEIYNFVELRRELETLGHVFRGHSDTEVLLAAFRQWGARATAKLRGMFAFAIWDSVERTLFAARDRFGIKPFHYVFDGRRLVFASELKALLAFVPRRANHVLAKQYLAWNLLEHEADQTFVQDIRRLPAAHTLSWTPGSGLQISRYWNLRVSDELVTPPGARATLLHECRERFGASVSLHLRSDVPVGTCLSGGLDSSSIVGLVSDELRRRGTWKDGWQHTFSACFAVPSLDERPYIESVVQKTECESHLVFPTGEGMADDLDPWLWHQEEPVASTGSYSQYCVARLARDAGIKVLLDGQGADEMLAGYRKFILVYVRQLASAGRYMKAAAEAAAFFASPDILRTSRLVDGRRYLFGATDAVRSLFNGTGAPERPTGLAIGPSLARRIEDDLFRFSLPVLLRYEDRNTMAFGIEARVPFIDHEFAEWAATLPADMRLSGGWTKRILREALAGVLPDKVRKRKSKLGFSTPESNWLAGPLQPWLADRLASAEHLGAIVDRSRVRALFARWRAGDRSLANENLLFRLAVYESWARMFAA